MKNSAEHILSLLTNLLNFSRLDQGKEVAILSKFNMETLCDELVEMFTPLAENKQLTFVYDKRLNENTNVKTDALKIKQILSNLLSNAIKYTIKGKITFKVSNNNKEIIFNIVDEGIGIPHDKLEEIFKPFSRVDNNESLIEGNGFGLCVVKGLIDLINGTIEVKSEPDKGSQFLVKIPIEYVLLNEKKDNTIDIDIQKLKSNNISSLYLLYGKEKYLIETCIKKIKVSSKRRYLVFYIPSFNTLSRISFEISSIDLILSISTHEILSHLNISATYTALSYDWFK